MIYGPEHPESIRREVHMSGSCTIVIPTYNEELNIVNMAKAIREAYPKFHILFMDDNSTDKSKELIAALHDPMITFFVRNPKERGLAASVLQGFVECGTDFFICMDCDFQHPISALGGIYSKLESGADLTIGTRVNRRAMGLIRDLGSHATEYYCKLFLFTRGKPLPEDLMSGLFGGRRGLWAPIINQHWDNYELTGWKVLLDMLKYGPGDIKMDKVYYMFASRAQGKSHISPKVVVTTFHQCGQFGKLIAKTVAAFTGIDYNKMYTEKRE